MPLVSLKRLKLRAFRSFAGEVEIEFPASGLLLIRGLNSATGESSGTGKSSILLGIAYALGTCPFPATDLQSWDSDEPLQVKLTLETPRGEATITRGKTSKLDAAWLPKPITSAKGVADELVRMFGVDTDTLRAITYRPQGEPGLFLSLTDGDKKEFLTRILGLTRIEERADEAADRAKDIKPLLESYQADVQQHKLRLEDYLTQTIPAPEPEDKLIVERTRLQAGLVSIKAEIDELQRRALDVDVEGDDFLKALRAKRDATETHLTKLIDSYQVGLAEFKARREQLRQQYEVYAASDAQRLAYAREKARLEGERQASATGQCFTCHRAWDGSQAKVAELNGQIANIDAQLENLKGIAPLKAKVEEQLRETYSTNPLIEQFKALRNRIEVQIANRESELKRKPLEESQARINELHVLRAETRAKLEGVERQLAMTQETNAKFAQLRKQLEGFIAVTRTKLAEAEAKVAEWTAAYAKESDFAAAMGYQGFLGAIFAEVLQDIEARTNERLAKLANVSHVTIRFKTESTDAAGKVNRTIVPLAYVNGHETRLKSGLSGGMYTSVEGVIDLAVMAVAQERTGTLPGFLMLDESFEGQGSVTKEAAMEVLREYGQEKLVIVVDHSSEIKEVFTQFIDVKQGASGISVIE